jgi:alanine racemase
MERMISAEQDADATDRVVAHVDLASIGANVRRLDELTGDAAMMVVVKADGYGHGLVDVAQAARTAGASWLGVAVLEEALALRASGDAGRLLCWLAVPGEPFDAAVAADVDVTASSVRQLAEVVAAARRVGRRARLQLKVDTGLSRNGAPPTEWDAVLAAAVQARDLVEVTGIWSHLACSDEPEHPANHAQEQAFQRAVAAARALGITPLLHLANSAAALTRPSARLDLVRCGIAAYGLSPIPQLASSAELGLRPAMTLQTRLAAVRSVGAGQGVSYGHTYVTERPTVLGLVPAGYADGVPRHASNRAEVLVGGRRRPVVGRVCMDQLVVDLGDEGAEPGDAVVLFGPGTAGEPTAQDWADAAETISYEIVTRLGGRTVRRHAHPVAGSADQQDAVAAEPA